MNENLVSINDKTWWQGCPPESESMPNFFNSPQIARIKKTKMWPNPTGHFKTCHVLRFLRFNFYKLHDQSPIYAIIDFSYCRNIWLSKMLSVGAYSTVSCLFDLRIPSMRNMKPPAKSNVAARGLQNGRGGLEKDLTLGYWSLQTIFVK